MTAGLAERLGTSLEQFTRERAAVTPVRRAGTTADVAAVIAFYVDGGRRL